MTQPSNVLTMDDADFLKDFNSTSEEVPAPVVEALPEPVVEEQAPIVETPAPEVETPVETPVAPEVPGEVAQPQAEVPSGEPAAPTPTPIDYQAAYSQIIGKTFKAGGKEVTVQTPEEAIQLMQMGVGFHQGMSKIAPHRRIIETLKEHGLLDESKINELIDISKKNPEAIAALVQSAGLEPHQLISSGDAQPYVPGDHVLPEAQLQFRTSVDNIREQGGTEFLTHVAQDWDVTSRAEVYKDPKALDMIYGHKQSGIYDKISSEVERRKLFDPSVANMPFIHAYLAVGDELHQKGLLASQQEPTTPAPVVPVPVVPAVAPQPVIPNPAAARAAPVRSTPTPASATPNFLTMPDDEFLKNHKPS